MTDLSSLSDEDIKRWKVENPLTPKQVHHSYKTTGPSYDRESPEMDPYTIGAYSLLFQNASNRIPTEILAKPWVIYNGEGDKSQVTYKGDVRWIHDNGNWGGTYTIHAHGYGIEYANDGTYTGTFNNGKRSGIGQLLFKNSLTIGFLDEGKFLSNIKTDKNNGKSIITLNSEKFFLEPYLNLLKVFGVNLKENIKTFIEKAENQAQIGLINFDNTIKDAEDKFDQLLCKPTETSTAVGVHNPNNQASKNTCYEYKNTGNYGYTENKNYTYFGNTNKDGKPNGLGQITKTSERWNGTIHISQTTVSTGNFVNGKLTGFGEIKQIEGSGQNIVFRYLGNFKDDLLHGCGIKLDPGEYSRITGYEYPLYFSDNFVDGSPPKETFMEKETNGLKPFWRGNNYYLVKKIHKEWYHERNEKVKNFFKHCEEVVKLAKEKQKTDIATAEIKTKNEIQEADEKKKKKTTRR